MTDDPQSWPRSGSDRWFDDVVEAVDDDKGRRPTRTIGVGKVVALLAILGVIAVVAFVEFGSVNRPVSKGQYCTTLDKWTSSLAHASAEQHPTTKELDAFSRTSAAYLQKLSDNPPDSIPVDVRSAVRELLAFFQAGVNGDTGISEQRFVRDGNLILAWSKANCRTSRM
jgi:hypothetical protein